MSRVDVLGSVPIFEQEICEDIMGGRSLPWGACRCRVLIREVGFSKGDGDAEAEQTCLRGDTAVNVTGRNIARRWGDLDWHNGRGGFHQRDGRGGREEPHTEEAFIETQRHCG